MNKNVLENGRSMIEMLEEVKQPLNAVLRQQAQVFRCCQSGRSMIEMLGVLAIIGVLSVGGIAGYSKAMHRYRVNKAIEQINYSAGAVRSFFASQKNYVGLSGYCYNNNALCTLYRKAKLVTDDMFGDYINNSGNTAHGGTANPFGGLFSISSTPKIADDTCSTDTICGHQAFVIGLLYLFQDACTDLITQDWSDAGVSMIRIYNYGNPISSLKVTSFLPPVSIDHAVKLCEMWENSTAKIQLYFFFDTDVTKGGYKTDIDATMSALDSN